jgi:hypothetical protein
LGKQKKIENCKRNNIKLNLRYPNKYLVEISAKGYLDDSFEINTQKLKNDTSFNLEIGLINTMVSTHPSYPRIIFELNKYDLDSASKKILDKIISVIKSKKYPMYNAIGLQGNRAKSENDKMSKERIKVVKKYLKNRLPMFTIIKTIDLGSFNDGHRPKVGHNHFVQFELFHKEFLKRLPKFCRERYN